MTDWNRKQWRRLARARDPDAVASAGYQVRISRETKEPDWDAFLARTPGGHHAQTSLWARVKSVLGWHAARVVARQGDHIVAGAQVLIRSVPLVGVLGYIPRGPLLASDDPMPVQLVMDALRQIAKDCRIQYLLVCPPHDSETLVHQLRRWGFRPSPIRVGQPTATLLIDLARESADILAQMRRATRQNIHRGLREGIAVREGTVHDLRTFYRLLVATSKRQRFFPYPENYFSGMWNVLDPHGYVKLFLADYEGEAVSALLAIPFGDAVFINCIGWSGCHRKRRPNDVLFWKAIEWAKLQGYRYCDLEGVDSNVAGALAQGVPLPDSLRRTPSFFKLGFGGQVTLFPEAYDYVYNPLLRWALNSMPSKIPDLPVVQNALARHARRLCR